MDGEYEEALERILEIERRMGELERFLSERMERLEAEVRGSEWR